MKSCMYFELNRHPAQVPRTKVEFWGGLISDLEHCAVSILGTFLTSNMTDLEQDDGVELMNCVVFSYVMV